MPDEVFISYARSDREKVMPVVDILRGTGISVWVDEAKIDAATLWSEEIVDAINNCKAMVVMLSQSSTGSDNVVKEVMLASENKKKILPVHLEPTEIPRKLQYQLAGIQHLEVFDCDTDGLAENLCRSLNRLGIQTGDSPIQPVTKPKTKRPNPILQLFLKPTKRTKSVAGILSLCVLTFLAGLFLNSQTVPVSENGLIRSSGVPFSMVEILESDLQISTVELGSSIAISPDGQKVAMVAFRDGQNSLYLRQAGITSWRQIPNTIDAANPVFSTKSERLYFSDKEGLKAASVVDNTVENINYKTTGGVALGDGFAVISTGYNRGLSLLDRLNGSEKTLTTLDHSAPDQADREFAHSWPQLMPDAKHVIFTSFLSELDKSSVRLCSIDGGEQVTLIENAIFGRYVNSGHLVFIRDDNLMAVTFDSSSLQVLGTPTPVLDDILVQPKSAASCFSISENGTLVYIKESESSQLYNLVWVHRDGTEEMLPLESEKYFSFDLSPNDDKLAYTVADSNNQDIWSYEFETGIKKRLTHKKNSQFDPVWLSGGNSIIYVSDTAPFDLFKYDFESQTSSPLITTKMDKTKPSISDDGRYVTFVQIAPGASQQKEDVYLIDMQNDKKILPISNTTYTESAASISPNGRYVAFQSDQNGSDQIYLAQTLNPKVTRQLTGKGGTEPVWASDGTELFFRNGTDLLALKIDPESGKPQGVPEVLFSMGFVRQKSLGAYKPSKSGDKFLILKEVPGSKANKINFVFNWPEELKQKVK